METSVKPDSRVHVRVYEDYETMSRAALEFILSRIRSAVEATGQATIALSGGTTPKRLFSLIASASSSDWPHVHFFWVDERCVSVDSAESNYKLAKDAFLSRISVKESNIHRIRGEAGADQAARDYEQDMRSFFGKATWPEFDLVLLGVGTDGHTASLFPGASALSEHTRLAIPLHFETPKPDRVTLSLAVLNHARETLFLATGCEKAVILHEILEDRNPRSYPAGMVKPSTGSVTWIIDREAAKSL
jgi:6-phosphogluconolactonase